MSVYGDHGDDDGPPVGPPGFWDAVFIRKPFEGRVEFQPIAEYPPTEAIAPGAFRELPPGPVPLRWGTEIDGPIVGYVTLSRLDDGTLLVSSAPDPMTDAYAKLRDTLEAGISPVRWAATYGLDETLEPPREPVVDPALVERLTAYLEPGRRIDLRPDWRAAIKITGV